MCVEVRLLVCWIRQLFFFFLSLASSNFSAIKCKVIKFASKCFQVFEWQPIKKAKYYSFRIHVLDVEEISYLLTRIPASDLERKTKKNVFPSDFPTQRCYRYWNNNGSCQQRSVTFLCPGEPRVKIRVMVGACWWATSLAVAHASARSAVSHLPPTIKE